MEDVSLVSSTRTQTYSEIDIRDGYQRYQSSNRGSEETDPAPTTMYM